MERIIKTLVCFRRHIFALYFLTVFLLLVIPLPPFLIADLSLVMSAGHFLMFFILYALLEFAHLFRTDTKLLLDAVALAILLEMIQLALPYRVFDWGDMALNVSGVFVSFLLFSRVKYNKVVDYLRKLERDYIK